MSVSLTFRTQHHGCSLAKSLCENLFCEKYTPLRSLRSASIRAKGSNTAPNIKQFSANAVKRIIALACCWHHFTINSETLSWCIAKSLLLLRTDKEVLLAER